MLIRLQADQISLFWDNIKDGLVRSMKVPDKYIQTFAIAQLIGLLNGDMQAWVGYDLDGNGGKILNYTLTTKIIDEKHYGSRILVICSLGGIRPLEGSMIEEVHEPIYKFAKANKCNVIAAEYSSKRVEEILEAHGFKKFTSTARLYI